MSLEKFCQRKVITVAPEESILDACRLMREKNIGCLVAEDRGGLCGILTDRDIALRVAGEGKDPKSTQVREIMTLNPVRISVDKSLHELTTLMHTFRVRRLPIVDGLDKTLGIVTVDDLISLLGEEMSDIGKTISETFPMGTA